MRRKDKEIGNEINHNNHSIKIIMLEKTFYVLLRIFLIVPASLEWQNNWDTVLNVSCADKQGFYRVRSQHSNYYEDRLWQWDSKSGVRELVR